MRTNGVPHPGVYLREMTPGQLADAAGKLKAALGDIKDGAIRREWRRAEGTKYRLTVSPPGRQMRLDRAPRGGPRPRADRALPLRSRHRLGHALLGAAGAVS